MALESLAPRPGQLSAELASVPPPALEVQATSSELTPTVQRRCRRWPSRKRCRPVSSRGTAFRAKRMQQGHLRSPGAGICERSDLALCRRECICSPAVHGPGDRAPGRQGGFSRACSAPAARRNNGRELPAGLPARVPVSTSFLSGLFWQYSAKQGCDARRAWLRAASSYSPIVVPAYCQQQVVASQARVRSNRF